MQKGACGMKGSVKGVPPSGGVRSVHLKKQQQWFKIFNFKALLQENLLSNSFQNKDKLQYSLQTPPKKLAINFWHFFEIVVHRSLRQTDSQ